MNTKTNYITEDKISVIVPVYNVEAYLCKCIDSIIDQTFKNLEIILVEDGSPDSCAEICDKYAGMDSRIKVIHKQNGGLSDARNHGIEQATGDYIGFVDSDDWIDSNMYELLYSKAIQYQADIAICGYYYVSNTIHTSYTVKEDTVFTKDEALIELAKDRIITNYAWNKLYKKELFAKVRYPVGYIYEDMATTYKVFALSNRIVAVKDCKYYYLSRASSITGSINFKHMYDNFYARYQQYKDLSERSEFEHRLFYELLLKAAVFAYCYKQKGHYYNTEKKKILINTLKSLYQEEEFHELDIIYRIIVFLIIKMKIIGSGLFNLGHKISFYPNIVFCIRELVNYLKNKKEYKETYGSSTKPVCYLVGTPEHRNLGDHAIAYAELKYITSDLPEYKVLELSEEHLIFRMRMVKRIIKNTDIITYHGGGNIGNQYPYERQRRWVIRHFPNNKIIIFPQTVYFTEDKGGLKQMRISRRIYKQHKQLTVMAREQYSYEILKEYFGVNTTMMPDMVLSLSRLEGKDIRQGALLCLRDDVESNLSADSMEAIKQSLKKYYDKVIITDTCVGVKIPIQERTSTLEAKWLQFRQAEIVITDRVHGMIFAAITGTPCIALDNYNYKIRGTYKWLEHLKYIIYINNPDEIEKAVLQLRELPSDHLYYDNRKLKEYFNMIPAGIKPPSFIDQMIKGDMLIDYNCK